MGRKMSSGNQGWILGLVIFCLALVTIAFNFGLIGISRFDEKLATEKYNTNLEKYLLLKQISESAITEEGILNLSKIPADKVAYNISNKGGNIILSYKLKSDMTSQNKAVATITMSENFSVISKEITPDMSKITLEEYLQSGMEASRKIRWISMFMCGLIDVFFLIMILFIRISSIKERKLREGKYILVHGWHSDQYLTQDELYTRVMEDSKSDYNWIASATELVRICNMPEFNKEYGVSIKCKILNCFANLELKREGLCSYQEPTDDTAVYSCYNSLTGGSTCEVESRKNFLNSIIQSIIKYDEDEGCVRIPVHCGNSYTKFCDEWSKSKFDELILRESLDFVHLRTQLNYSFEEELFKADKAGVFTEDDEKYWEKIAKDSIPLDVSSILQKPYLDE